jgi:hypothetical protein
MKSEPPNLTASQVDFLNVACTALAGMMAGILAFDLFKNNVLAAKCGFLAFVIRTFIGLRTYHRHKILKTRTIGRLGPFLAFAAALATVSIHQLDIIP